MSSEKEDKKTNEKLLEEMKLMQSKMDALQEEVKKKNENKDDDLSGIGCLFHGILYLVLIMGGGYILFHLIKWFSIGKWSN